MRKNQIQGILIGKKDLHRGNFLMVIKDKNEIKKIDLSGYDFFYEKILLNDSLVKELNSFRFFIYRKILKGKYIYEGVIGYK
ncbi:hypothetical protein [Ferruginibacter profundus]